MSHMLSASVERGDRIVEREDRDARIENQLREANDLANVSLPRMALKMASGFGKTVVMAMLIA